MRQLTTERAAIIILFALLFALAARIPTDTDTWWHIRSGEYTLTHGMIYADPFSFTKAGEPWINHSWGSQIILYGVWQLAGNVGLAVYTAGLATAGMWFIYRMCAGNTYLRAFALVLGAATAAVFWSPRPQMLSFVLSAAVLYLLHLHKRRGVDRLWWIPVIMGVWGNLHAGFSIGFIFLGGSIAGEILGNIFTPKAEAAVPWRGIRKLILVSLVSAAALLVNPYGAAMLAVPFQTLGIGALQNFIQEWNSPDFHQQQTWPFVALLFGTLGAVGASSKRLDWRDFVLVVGTAFMGLLAGRNIAVFAVVATPVLTLHLAAALDERGWILTPVRRVTPRMARLNALLVGLVLLGALAKVLLVLDAETVQTAQEEFLPVRAVDYLNETEPPGPMFNSYNWGGYLLFARPAAPVFVDGRTDLYGDAFLTDDYLKTATGGNDWRETLDSYGIRLVVVEAGSGLARALRDESGWSLDYEDEQAVVFTREAAE
ncbi:MAG: hypothetical protein H6671_12845 [Anaerolineaceae bacterium]|nr:hypothetical protein [Anaerolineaceae bacterium]